MADKRESYEHFREMWGHNRNLTDQELNELLAFEFEEGPSNVSEQVRRYFLKLKEEKPEKARKMWKKLNRVLEKGITGLDSIKEVCAGIYKFFSGFAIEYQGESYSMHNNQFGTVHELHTPPSTWKPNKESRLVQISEDEAEKLKLKLIDLARRGLPLSNDGYLMLTVPSSDGRITVKSHFELTPEGLEGQLQVPKESSHFSVRWGAIIGGNMSENGRQAYIRFYSKQD